MKSASTKSQLLQRLREALGSARGSNPQKLRYQVVEVVREVANAPIALFYTFGMTSTGVHIARNTVASGDTEPVLRLLKGIFDEPERYSSELPDATQVSERERRSFLETAAIFRQETFAKRKLTRELYLPLGLGDQIRLLPFDGERSLGWLGAFRYSDQEAFTYTDRRRLNPFVTPMIELLKAADALERDQTPSKPAFVVVSLDGKIEFLSAEAKRWLSHLDAFDASPTRDGSVSSDILIPLSAHVGVKVVPLKGRAGQRHLLWFEPLRNPALSPEADLTPTQREIVELLLAGATHDEIAHHRGCTRETVRSHVRNIYERLGVTTLVELARVLGQTPS